MKSHAPPKIVLILFPFIVAVPGLLSAVETAQPNILFIFSDDQATGTIGAYGNELIKTPNLDRLAKEGVRFNHAYNQGSFAAAVCVASRTMLNTGESIWNAARFAEQRDFHSLMPLARGETDDSHYDAIYGCYFGVQRMVRTQTHKMILYPAANRVRLYDVVGDPLEMNDLAENREENKALLKEMLAELQKLQRQLGDPVDVTQSFDDFMNGVAPSPCHLL